MSELDNIEQEIMMDRAVKMARVNELMRERNEFTVLADFTTYFADKLADGKREEVAYDIVLTIKRLNRMSEKQKEVLVACLVEREAPNYEW